VCRNRKRAVQIRPELVVDPLLIPGARDFVVGVLPIDHLGQLAFDTIIDVCGLVASDGLLGGKRLRVLARGGEAGYDDDRNNGDRQSRTQIGVYRLMMTQHAAVPSRRAAIPPQSL